jgi:geranylgeranyl diphosphate synthase type I
LDLAYDLLDSGGKRWRPVLGMMFAEAFGRDFQKSMKDGDIIEKNGDILYACALTEIIHNGSLMADDLEDKSLMRRGKPCTYI